MTRVRSAPAASRHSVRLLRATTAVGALTFAALSGPASFASTGVHVHMSTHPALPTAENSHAVMIHGYTFMPATLTIRAGDTVTWTNDDAPAHNVIATRGASFRSPLLATGQSWSWTATVATSVSYECSLHPGMDAHLTVLAAPTPVPNRERGTVGTSTSTSTSTTTSPTHPNATAVAAPVAVATTPTAPTTDQAASTAAPARASLDPMLLVVAIAVATVLFCLLLLAGGSQRTRYAAESESVPPGWIVMPADELEALSGSPR